MTINEAIKYYQQAQKENTKAQAAAKAAAETARAARGKIKSFNENNYTTAKEAGEAETTTRAAANICQAITIAASYNVLEVARNTIYNEVTAAPEKFNKPMHYKVQKDHLNAICGDDFYIYTTYSCVYIRYPNAAGEKEIFLFDTNDDGTINLDRPYINNRKPELTLKEIKKEVRQAAKDAEKLRKAAENIYNTSEAMRNKYNSYVRYILPHSDKYFLHDDYKLF